MMVANDPWGVALGWPVSPLDFHEKSSDKERVVESCGSWSWLEHLEPETMHLVVVSTRQF